MANMFLVFNHTLTENQKADACENFGIGKFIILPPELQGIWSTIPPCGELDINLLDSIRDWLLKEAKYEDYILIQGDPGAVYYLVDFALSHYLQPVYATTTRSYNEHRISENQIETHHIFTHKSFRRYIPFRST